MNERRRPAPKRGPRPRDAHGAGRRNDHGRGPARPRNPRALAIDLLDRIELDGAYANIVVPAALDRTDFSRQQRGLVTDLSYGVTRQFRRLDWMIDRFARRDMEQRVRQTLRIGVYQLLFTDAPDHAAVSETVAVAPEKAKGFVNAILRKVAANRDLVPTHLGQRLSYPDWLVERLEVDLGEDRARQSLEAMNRPPSAHVRPDGYVQDAASQLVVSTIPLPPGARVIDLCAAPGGKASALAARGAAVIAADKAASRSRLMAGNLDQLATVADEAPVPVVQADATRPAFREESFDVVLLDAPCSGLGVLHGRADARWRVSAEEIDRLSSLQVSLIDAASALVAPGGLLVYSVCTLTTAETIEVVERFLDSEDGWTVERPEDDRLVTHGPGSLILPDDCDGMFMAHLRRGAEGGTIPT